MGVGGMLAVLSFIMAGLVELKLEVGELSRIAPRWLRLCRDREALVERIVKNWGKIELNKFFN